MECLTNVIGISQSPCACLQSELPEDYDVSTSGLYLDELPESPIRLEQIKNITECGRDMAYLLNTARINAVNVFRTELFKQMQSRFALKDKPYDGFLGKASFTSTLNLTRPYAGLMLEAKNYRGATITISKIGVAFDATKSFNLLVYKTHTNASDNELLQTIPLNSSAGVLLDNMVNVILPLADETGKNIKYYFVYEIDGFLPKNNDVSCGCGTAEHNLKKYVYHKGVVGDDLDNLKAFSQNNYSNGLMFTVHIGCGSDDLICENYNENPYINAAISAVIQKKAVEILIRAILASPNINRTTMGDREFMGYNASRLKKQFSEDLQWIGENMIIGDNDCYNCTPKAAGYQKTGILL